MGVALLWVFACAGSENQLRGASEAAPARPEEVGSAPPVRPTVGPDGSVALSPGQQCGARLFEPGAIHDIHLALDDAALAGLLAAPDEDVAASFTWEGGASSVALHLKGSGSFRTMDGKPSFKIDAHQWASGQRIDGCKRITLNNMVQDKTMLREHSYYWFAERVGLPAPRHTYARVWVNDAFYGFYSLVETEDEQFIDRAWPDDDKGNLYEASGADLTTDRDWFELEEDGGHFVAPDDIDALVTTLQSVGDDGFYDALVAAFDTDELLDFFAVETLTGNDDGYVFNHNNYRLYHAPDAGRWYFLPWGTDRSFTDDVAPQGSLDYPLVGDLAIRCWAAPACADALSARLRDLADVWDAELPAFLDGVEPAIATECAADPRREHSCAQSDLVDFVTGRTATVRAALEQAPE